MAVQGDAALCAQICQIQPTVFYHELTVPRGNIRNIHRIQQLARRIAADENLRPGDGKNHTGMDALKPLDP